MEVYDDLLSRGKFDKVSTKILNARMPKRKNKIIPLLIKLRPPSDNKQFIHKTRIIAAVLKALQSIYTDTYLATIHDDHAWKDMISNPINIPMDIPH